jgi:hypothetical protein
MTLHDYLNQTEIKKLPLGSVEVSNEYIIRTFNRYNPTSPNKLFKTCIYSIPMLGDYFVYIKEGECSTLFTMDEDGNAKNPSVFCAIP